MLTHRNFYANAYHFIAHLGISHDDVEMWTLPMFHCNGWGGVYALTAMGGKHVVVRVPEPDFLYGLMRDEGVTFACMAPAVLARILDFEDAGEYEIATRPRFVCAGAPPPITFVERLEKERGWTFMQIYGLTETAPILTVAEPKPHVNTEGDALYRLKGRAGHPSLGVQLRVVGEGGRDVPWDDTAIGEVAARGNMVFKGYWDQPGETAKVVRDGYFYHRRPRHRERARLHQHRRPRQGRHHLRRREHFLDRGRGRALPASQGAGGGGRWHPQRALGRDAPRRHRPAAGAKRPRPRRSRTSAARTWRTSRRPGASSS